MKPLGRVISLVPSVTETLTAWGVTPVACTRFCERPDLAHVGGTKDPDLDAITALQPDLVVMDREENRREDADELRRRGVAVHALHVTSIDGLDDELASLAEVVGVAAPEPVRRRHRPARAAAVTLIWKRPLMGLGHGTYGSSLLADLGVRNALDPAAGRYPVLDEVALDAVDLLLLPSEPYPFAARHAASDEVRSVAPGARPVLLDGQDLLWWGSRTNEALARLDVLMASRLPAR